LTEGERRSGGKGSGERRGKEKPCRSSSHIMPDSAGKKGTAKEKKEGFLGFYAPASKRGKRPEGYLETWRKGLMGNSCKTISLGSPPTSPRYEEQGAPSSG